MDLRKILILWAVCQSLVALGAERVGRALRLADDRRPEVNYQGILQEISQDPLEVLKHIHKKMPCLSFEQYKSLATGLIPAAQMYACYQRETADFKNLQERYETPTREIDVSLIEFLYECVEPTCPYNRFTENSQRQRVLAFIEKQLQAIRYDQSHVASLSRSLQDDQVNVFTIFASGNLFHELQVIQLVHTYMRQKDRPVEINLIDTSYKYYMKASTLEEFNIGSAIYQFNRLVHSLFPNVQVFVYHSARNYIKDVLEGHRPATDLLLAIDYANPGPDAFAAKLDFTMLDFIASSPEHASFSFPYDVDRSCARYFSAAINEDDKRRLLELGKEIKKTWHYPNPEFKEEFDGILKKINFREVNLQ